ncbi:mitochondrial nuclease [Paracoccidioides lutzii Pb01]|uniref:Endonuclease n=1 Tax=Paracoccidioides lutzii (strain ATCC MYA-826 / Pb01) TaxID=502779 RepID=C1HE74_PARBA|nr:mitochondrial nuclease [Paracoccidioides lutzii Pb01]EEH40614.1 mitochondrial nuclease [Paracoccidioides lutzii Pb01]
MSKASFALIAAAGAATGAGVTALIYSSRTCQQQLVTPPPSTRLPPQTTTQPTSLLIPPHPKITTPDTTSPVDPVGLFQYGFPGPVCDPVITPPLASAFDRRTRNPSWVAEHITPESLAQNNADRKQSNFYEEQTIPQAFRARLTDYFRSGYDRGHQVPAADAKWSQIAMDATFSLANMCPQVGEGFNRDYWAHFEDFCRRLTKVYPSVRIVTGPLYLPKRDPVDGKWRVTYEVIGNPPNVAVPTHFYKVIFAEDGVTGGKVSLGAFVLPNARIPNEKSLADFEVPLEAVERASGLEFASKLPAERRKKLCQEVKCEIITRQFVQSSNDIKALRSS